MIKSDMRQLEKDISEGDLLSKNIYNLLDPEVIKMYNKEKKSTSGKPQKPLIFEE